MVELVVLCWFVLVVLDWIGCVFSVVLQVSWRCAEKGCLETGRFCWVSFFVVDVCHVRV